MVLLLDSSPCQAEKPGCPWLAWPQQRRDLGIMQVGVESMDWPRFMLDELDTAQRTLDVEVS